MAEQNDTRVSNPGRKIRWPTFRFKGASGRRKPLDSGSGMAESRDTLDDWLRHVGVAATYNRAVANANMRGYFDGAAHVVVGAPRAMGGPFEYVVPGEEPDNAADRFVYRLLLAEAEAREARADACRAVLRSLLAWVASDEARRSRMAAEQGCADAK